MAKYEVSFYSAEVEYSGDFTDYTEGDLFEMALAKQDRGIDCFDHLDILSEAKMKTLKDVYVEHTYPCNKICTVSWICVNEVEMSEEERDYQAQCERDNMWFDSQADC